jgi:hypothetical protein
MKHKDFCLALCAVLLLGLCVPAWAADPDYSGPLNIETGEPLYSGNSQSGTERVALSKNMYYDWSWHEFAYPIGNSLSEVHSNAADGMVLTSPVSLTVSGEATLSVFRDGVEYTGSLERIDEVGGYTVSATEGGQTRRLLSFVLVGPTTNALHNFVVPDGFYILEATRDGEPIYSDRYSLSMQTEGAYVVEYECSATDLVYKLETSIDRTPTVLNFEGTIDRQGRVRSALKFSGAEEGDSLFLTDAGESVDVKVEKDGTGVIKDPGIYTLIVKDPAGNTTEYSFIILQYFNMQSWIFILLVVCAVAAVVVYVLTQRKKLKIA